MTAVLSVYLLFRNTGRDRGRSKDSDGWRRCQCALLLPHNNSPGRCRHCRRGVLFTPSFVCLFVRFFVIRTSQAVVCADFRDSSESFDYGPTKSWSSLEVILNIFWISYHMHKFWPFGSNNYRINIVTAWITVDWFILLRIFFPCEQQSGS